MEANTTVVSFRLNGRPVTATVPAHWTLLKTLRDGLAAYEVKDGCSEGDCGACAVLLDGVAVNACMVPIFQVEDCAVVTVKGVSADERTAGLVDGFVEGGGVQCGYCTPGMMMAAAELLMEDPAPNRAQIRAAISGNLCRCTGYTKIIDSIELAAAKRGERA